MARLAMIPIGQGDRTWLNLDNVCAVVDRPIDADVGEVAVYTVGDTEAGYLFSYESGEQRDAILCSLGVPDGDLTPVIQCGGEG